MKRLNTGGSKLAVASSSGSLFPVKILEWKGEERNKETAKKRNFQINTFGKLMLKTLI